MSGNEKGDTIYVKCQFNNGEAVNHEEKLMNEEETVEELNIHIIG